MHTRHNCLKGRTMIVVVNFNCTVYRVTCHQRVNFSLEKLRASHLICSLIMSNGNYDKSLHDTVKIHQQKNDVTSQWQVTHAVPSATLNVTNWSVKLSILSSTAKQLRNRCTTAIRVVKSFFHSCARSRPKAFWRQMKLCTGLGKIKVTISPWPCSTPAICKESANAVNQHFTTTVSELVPQRDTPFALLLPVAPLPSTLTASSVALTQSFSFRLVSAVEVKHTLHTVPLSGSIGSDDLSGHIV